MKYIFIFLLSFLLLGSGSDWWHSPESESIPFDNSASDLTSTALGPALRELEDRVDVSASPGFTWGKSGNITNTWLLNDTVPSNLAGRIVPIDGYIAEAFAACEDPATGTFSIYKRSGATFTLITTLSFTSQRTGTQSYTTGTTVVKGDELAIKVTSGSFKNPIFGLVIKGSL